MAMQEEVVQISIMENESKNYNSNVELNGILTLNPKQEKKGIVIFAHGSGSGRDSPRNQYVASVLNNNSGIGTLLVDLLTLEEQQIDEKTREYRFNIKLLVNRLAAVTDWLLQHSGVRTQNISSISMGYFGSSTGAAAALIAAAERSDDVVKAIISRGGRPDLAGSSNAQLGKKTYVEQEIDAVIHAGKSKQKAIDVVKTQSLQNMVLRKFHNLNNRETSQRFYTISSDNRYLILDNNLFKLFFEDNDDNGNQSQFMRNEITSRWDLLEHAFENIHNVELLDVDQYLEHVIRKERRTNLTKLVHLLEGYQRGRCFYCNEPLHEQIAVDHVIPYQALMHNQLWNLVLADTFCNENKSDNIAPLHYIENLIARNEFFISSAHPLKDTLVRELGSTQQQRRQKVMKEYSYAKGKIVRIWGGSDKYDPSKDPFYRSWVNFLG